MRFHSCTVSGLKWTGLLYWTTCSRLKTTLRPITSQTQKRLTGLYASGFTQLNIANSNLVCSRLSVSVDDRKSGQAQGGVSRPLLYSPARIPLIADPTRRAPAFSIVPIDREPGTG